MTFFIPKIKGFEIKMKNSYFYILAVSVSLIVLISVFVGAPYKTSQSASISGVDKNIVARFEELSTNGNVFCFGPDAVLRKSDSETLKGSCCDEMSLHRYDEQIEGLKKYSHIDKIPTDPYNITVGLAKELLNYDTSIILTSEEQKIYDEAMKMSDEGGPCCCMCWRWYVYEGLAKYLIKNYGFNSAQIADVWNLSDGCGGEEHATGIHV